MPENKQFCCIIAECALPDGEDLLIPLNKLTQHKTITEGWPFQTEQGKKEKDTELLNVNICKLVTLSLEINMYSYFKVFYFFIYNISLCVSSILRAFRKNFR